MGSKSRNKGAGFENQVAKLVSAAFGTLYKRTPLSGGWAKGNKIAAGDLVPIDSEQRFCFECKKVEGWTLDGIFSGNRALFSGWWKQLLDECPAGIIPVLVFSRNRAPIYVAVRNSDVEDDSVFAYPYAAFSEAGVMLNIFLLENFLTFSKPL
jgi:hypothetical protein